jgi:transposase-like protein
VSPSLISSVKRRKEVAADLRRIYAAATAEEAEMMLGEFEDRWDAEYLPIGQSWRRNRSRLTPLGIDSEQIEFALMP